MSDYAFSYVTYGELDDLESRHPVVHESGKGPQGTRYQGCPTISGDFPCFFYLTTRRGELVASTSALPDVLVTKGSFRPWVWTGDLFTEEAFRGEGLATVLQRESTRLLHRRGIGRASVFSSDTSVHIHQKGGETLVGYAARYLVLKSAGPFLRAHLRSRGVTRVLDALSRPIIGSAARMCWASGRARSPGTPGLDERVVALDQASADRFASLQYSTPFHFDDSLAAIRWKLEQANANPASQCDLHLLTDSHDTPVGFFITRLKHVSQPLGGKYQGFFLLTLMHFGLFENDAGIHPALLDQLLELFWKSPAEVLEVITNCEPLLSAARSRGMLRVGKGMSFTFAVPGDWNFEAGDYELQRWPLTHFCGDGFTF